MVNKRVQEKRERNKKDKEWRETILKIYDGKCVICGDTKRPNAHHIIPRTFEQTRWDLNNGIILCPKHHKFGKFSAHKNPLWFFIHFIGSEPDKWNYLINKSQKENGNK